MNKKKQSVQTQKHTKGSSIPLKGDNNIKEENTTIGREEFEEDRSSNIRMKPQPLGKAAKILSNMRARRN
jgi:hypothetical protein